MTIAYAILSRHSGHLFPSHIAAAFMLLLQQMMLQVFLSDFANDLREEGGKEEKVWTRSLWFA